MTRAFLPVKTSNSQACRSICTRRTPVQRLHVPGQCRGDRCGLVPAAAKEKRSVRAQALAPAPGTESWWKANPELWEEARSDEEFWELVNDDSVKLVMVGAHISSPCGAHELSTVPGLHP